jgi:hypothetical protein
MPERTLERDRKPSRSPQLNQKQTGAIEAVVMRMPARDLERVLSLRLATFEEREEGGEEPEAPVEEEEEEAAFESLDMDGFDADEEGDFTEEEESPLLLDGIGAKVPEGQKRRADVVIEHVEAEGVPSLVVRSGISDLLLRLRGRDPLTNAYHRCLRERIADTLYIAGRILARNSDYFLQKRSDKTLLRQKELWGKTEINRQRLSRLLSAAVLLSHRGEEILFEEFFSSYSRPYGTSEDLLRVFVERSEEDLKGPLSDNALARYVRVLQRTRDPLPPGRVRKARGRLGIPNADHRREGYDQGLDLIAMAGKAGKAEHMRQSLEMLVDRVEGPARQTVEAWLARIERHIQEAKGS